MSQLPRLRTQPYTFEKPEHEVEILHGGARGAFPEVVQARYEQQLLVLFGNENFHLVGAIATLRRQKPVL